MQRFIELNEWIYSLDRKTRQSVNQEHRSTIIAYAYRCPESTIIQLRGAIDYVVKTQHYENKSRLATKKYENTCTKRNTEKRKIAKQYTHDQLVTVEFNRYNNVQISWVHCSSNYMALLYHTFIRVTKTAKTWETNGQWWQRKRWRLIFHIFLSRCTKMFTRVP